MSGGVPEEFSSKVAANAQDSDQYFQLLTNHIADQVYEKVDKQNTRSRNRFAVIASSITGLVLLVLSSGAGMLIDFLDRSAKTTAEQTAERMVPDLLKGTAKSFFDSSVHEGLQVFQDIQRESLDVITIQALAQGIDQSDGFLHSEAKEINRLILSFAESDRYRKHETFPETLVKAVRSYLMADRLDLVFEFEEKFRDVQIANQGITDVMVDALGRDLAAHPAGIIRQLSDDSPERSRWLEKREIYRHYANALGTTHRKPENPYLYDILIACTEGGNDADLEMLVRKAIDFQPLQLEGLAFMGQFIGGISGARYDVAKSDWRDCLERGLEYDTKDNALGTALAHFVNSAFGEIHMTDQP